LLYRITLQQRKGIYLPCRHITLHQVTLGPCKPIEGE